MFRLWKKLNNETGGAMVENVIVLPLVFIVILFLIMSAFLIHDRTTLEAAARRGATYAAHCIADPNYVSLVGHSGELDMNKDADSISFSSIGKNVKAYRYIGRGPNVSSDVEQEVKKIIEKTRINWLSQDNVTVTCRTENKIIYQDVTVTVRATYHLPKWFETFGMESDYTIETEAKITAVDPDEFIRNVDLVVDIIVKVDGMTGGNLSKVADKIKTLGQKLLDWVDMG